MSYLLKPYRWGRKGLTFTCFDSSVFTVDVSVTLGEFHYVVWPDLVLYEPLSTQRQSIYSMLCFCLHYWFGSKVWAFVQRGGDGGMRKEKWSLMHSQTVWAKCSLSCFERFWHVPFFPVSLTLISEQYFYEPGLASCSFCLLTGLSVPDIWTFHLFCSMKPAVDAPSFVPWRNAADRQE